mmetsp:Transcript_25662/g.66995  ORF Transcript_25662/g.66995 Transcript_25662/m.66995 type:complete len:239 (+) Transcript_25662:556-1272(+)
MARDDLPLGQEGDHGLRGHEEALHLLHQGPLVAAVRAGLRAGEHPEAGPLQGRGVLLRGGSAHRADDRLGLPQQVAVVGVVRPVVVELEPVEEGQLGAGLQNPEHLQQQPVQVLDVRERLHVVERVERLVREGQRVIVVSLHKLELGSEHAVGLGMLLCHPYLRLVDVKTHYRGPRVACDVMRNASSAAAYIKDSLSCTDVELVSHAFLLPEQLVAKYSEAQVHDGGNVHLLHLTNST